MIHSLPGFASTEDSDSDLTTIKEEEEVEEPKKSKRPKFSIASYLSDWGDD